MTRSYWSDPGHHPPPPVWVLGFTLAWAASLGYCAARCALAVHDHLRRKP